MKLYMDKELYPTVLRGCAYFLVLIPMLDYPIYVSKIGPVWSIGDTSSLIY